jgi:hypothetical protein
VKDEDGDLLADSHNILKVEELLFSVMGEKRNAYRLLVGKPEGKRPLRRRRRRWVDNIRIDLGEVRPPLDSGQSSWLQILRPEFDSRRYQIF